MKQPYRKIITLVVVAVLCCAATGQAAIEILGNQTVEATGLDLGGFERIRGGIFKITGTAPDYADSITAYLDFIPDMDVTTWNVRAALYVWRGPANNATLVDSADSRSFSSGTTSGWQGFKLRNNRTVYVDTTYLLCVWSNSSASDELQLRYNSASTGDTIASKTLAMASWPSPLASTTTTNSARMSIYLTYITADAVDGQAGDTSACTDGWAYGSTGTSANIENGIHFGNIVATQSLMLKSIRVYHSCTGTGSGLGIQIKCAVYKASDSTLVDETEEISYSTTASANGMFVYNFPQPAATLVSGTAYWVGVWGESGAWTLLGRYLAPSGGAGRLQNSQTYAAWPSPMPDASTRDASFNDRFTIQMFYNCATAGGTRLPFMQKVGWIDWQLRTFTWESLKRFAGDCNDIEN